MTKYEGRNCAYFATSHRVVRRASGQEQGDEVDQIVELEITP